MKTITTENSYYEIDEEHKKIRRLYGMYGPTTKFEQDQVWHDYQALTRSKDSRLVIIWEIVETPGEPTIAKTTITSPIIREQNDAGSDDEGQHVHDPPGPEVGLVLPLRGD